MYKPLISIIVPIYNVEDYIERCVASIVKQTYDNLEIILVDDGSKDTSGVICDTWKKKDDRIDVIHQTNQGLSAARNSGTEIASGDYLFFLDGDDEISENCISSLLELTRNGEMPITQCDYGEFIDGTKKLHGDQRTVKEWNAKDYIASPEFLTMACGKLILSSLAKKHLFPIGRIHEDVAVIPQMVYEAGKIVTTQKSLYFYNLRDSSINTKENYYLKHLDILDFIEANIQFYYSKKERVLVETARRQYIYELLSQYAKVKQHFPERKDILKDIKQRLRENVRKIHHDSALKPHTKVLLQISAIWPEVWQKATKG